MLKNTLQLIMERVKEENGMLCYEVSNLHILVCTAVY